MSKYSYITVFGATGQTGSELVQLLSRAGIPAIAVTRNRNKAMVLPFVTWVEADVNIKESLTLTMINSKAVFLVSAAGEHMVQEQCNVIDAAVSAGVDHIVRISSAMADKHSSLFIAKAHGQIDEYLKASGIGATLLRPDGFMQNWLSGLAHAVKTKRIINEATGDGKRAFIDLRDIAEVAFRILLEPEKHDCHAYLLTGGEAINYEQLAAIITECISEKVSYVPVNPEHIRRQLAENGVPFIHIELFMAYRENQRTHQAAQVSNDAADILGRPARTVKSFINEHITFFNNNDGDSN